MKKRILSLLVISVLLLSSTAAYANNTNEDGANSKLEERNEELVKFLKGKPNKDNYQNDIENFFKNHSEYKNLDIVSSDNPKVVKVYKLGKDYGTTLRSTRSVSDITSKDYEIKFLDNGNFVISELEVTVPNGYTSFRNSVIRPSDPSKIASHTENIYNFLGAYIGRTFVEAEFLYNGKNVYTSSNKRKNVRVLHPAYSYRELNFNTTYPSEYNNKVCRVSLVTDWNKVDYKQDDYPAGYLDNRVSCNINGKIFTSDDRVEIL